MVARPRGAVSASEESQRPQVRSPSGHTLPSFLPRIPGWLGGAMVLGKLPVPGRPTNLDYSKARAYCTFSWCRWGLFGHFFLPSIISRFFLPLPGRRSDID